SIERFKARLVANLLHGSTWSLVNLLFLIVDPSLPCRTVSISPGVFLRCFFGRPGTSLKAGERTNTTEVRPVLRS
ncbi:unnamed protein product, partial [Linum tenue]